ncbi:TonB-dependent receptor domain-containing protein [Mucilaginibacter sp. KACC 22063]|uniref:TonB-dependent receptor domain-containing protein n=1 Tax=Mucilaginibacter sp. KACC 22063 TaxID=3025666 RepID=UPI002365B3A5|nr:TonB-dependent receptor [Mucilaginibacter sp. KACC 22063]WDF54871.1 outer membrane beta-barrel protein [Mucilaginibacter sp. KACC 22063]
MKVLILILSIMACGFMCKAQKTTCTVTLLIKDAGNNALPGATVRIYKVGDSVAVKAGSTDMDGQLIFNNLSNGAYFFKVSAIGQNNYQSPAIQLNKNAITLPPVILIPAKNRNLAEVVISAKRPLMQTEIDRTIVNVESMISSASSNSLEVLEKTPGVSVNANGEISLNGRSGVMVLIDGRQTYMSGQSLTNYLKSLPGGVLDKIELMDNPPAKYDASGNAIINIKLKKNRAGGFTGSIQTGYSQGKYGRNNNSLNLNYNHKKLNVFGNFSFNTEKNYTRDDYERNFYTPTSELNSRINLHDNTVSRMSGTNSIIGLDYNASENTTYGAQINFNRTTQPSDYSYYNQNFNPLVLDSIGSGSTFIKDKATNWSTNVNYAHKYGKSGRELTIDANYLNYDDKNEQWLDNYTYAPTGEVISNRKFFYHIPSSIQVYNAKADYAMPLKNKLKLEGGVKTSFVNNDNIADYYTIINQDATIDNSLSNHFKYSENINAAYINAQKSWKYLALQAGLRAENTHAEGRQLGNAEVAGTEFTKDYTRLFPSLFINYKLDTVGRQSFNFSISRRINRPSYQVLNPFVFIRDQYSYTSGNPLLTPQYQYRYEIKYQYRQALRLGLSYNDFTDVIFRTTTVTDNIFITKPQNIGKGFMYILNVGSSLSPYKWWYFNLDMQILRMGLNGQVDGVTLDVKNSVVRGGVQNQFSISKRLSAELFGYYISSDLNGQAYTHAMFRTNAAIQLKILNSKGSIRFNVDDIFHSWVYHNYSADLRQAAFTQTTASDTRRFGLAFTYRFGKDLFKRKRKYDNNGLDDERGRLQPN